MQWNAPVQAQIGGQSDGLHIHGTIMLPGFEIVIALPVPLGIVVQIPYIHQVAVRISWKGHKMASPISSHRPVSLGLMPEFHNVASSVQSPKPFFGNAQAF